MSAQIYKTYCENNQLEFALRDYVERFKYPNFGKKYRFEPNYLLPHFRNSYRNINGKYAVYAVNKDKKYKSIYYKTFFIDNKLITIKAKGSNLNRLYHGKYFVHKNYYLSYRIVDKLNQIIESYLR